MFKIRNPVLNWDFISTARDKREKQLHAIAKFCNIKVDKAREFYTNHAFTLEQVYWIVSQTGQLPVNSPPPYNHP